MPQPACDRFRSRVVPAGARPAAATLALAVVACLAPGPAARGGDAPTAMPLAPQGTPFHFAVIESRDAEYLGDTPAHMGKDGGLTMRPNVALGDPVYRTTNEARIQVGHVTRVVWNRVSGSLEIEFDPEPLQRVAVGDVVWIDLNPAPVGPDASAAGR